MKTKDYRLWQFLAGIVSPFNFFKISNVPLFAMKDKTKPEGTQDFNKTEDRCPEIINC